LEKRTGVKIKFTNVSEADGQNQFSLLLASGQFPDMIYYTNWISHYPGAPAKLLDDQIALPLNDLIDKYAPNFKKVMADHPAWRKMATTDDGKFWCFPFIRGAEELMVFFGPILRKDLLDELKLPVPETMAEWHATLTALKAKVAYPLTMNKGGRNIETGHDFIGAYKLQWGWFIDGDKVKYGQYEPAYKDFLTTWSAWYKEGLIDPDFLTDENKQTDSKMLNGKAAAVMGYTGSNIGKYMDAMAGKDGKFDLIGAPHPVLKKGDKPWTGQIDQPLQPTGYGLVISTQCKDPETAVKWADYAYGPEGHILFNFGTEGVSFNWAENYPGFEGQKFPQYTELITKNPNKLTTSAALKIWLRAGYSGPFVQDKRYFVQYLKLAQQRKAVETWMQGDATLHKEPPFSLTPKESEEFAQIMSQVETYMREMYARYTTGQDSLDTFDKYREQLKKMGIEKAIAIKQAAYERYLKK
jgi:putative aldouronate transport system substrate-binding protein